MRLPAISRFQKIKPILVAYKSLNSIIGFLVLGLIAIAIAYFNSNLSLTLVAALTILIAAITFVLFCFISPKFGFFISLLIPFIGFELQRLIRFDIPLGFAIQGLFILLLVLLLFKGKVNRDLNFKLLYNPITYIILISYVYLIIQFFNPEMGSLNGWFFAFRAVTGRYLIFFVALLLIKDLRFIKHFFYAWIFLAFTSALYACYQEWIGIPSYILSYIHADPLRLGLYYINGKYRIFSLLSDPAAFGIFMAGSFLVTFILALYTDTYLKKTILLLAAISMLLASAYSGTRTSYAMIPAGMLLFTLMTITNKRTLMVVTILSLIFGALIFGPFYGNPTLNRIRSTFNGEDASLNVRDVNRARIQAYIYDHPIGGGVMTVGVAGLEYNPEHQLAGFPPDSGYLYAVLETGWVGLGLVLIFFYISMREAVKCFYRSKHKKIRAYSLAITVFTFSVAVASYAQVILGQIPISLFIYSALAIVVKLNVISTQQN